MAEADRELVRRMLAGEERAFEEFFAAAFPGLYRFALSRLGGDGDAAEEVAQAALCRAVGKLATFRGEAALFTWLCTFCRHEIATWLRRRRPGSAADLAAAEAETAASWRTGDGPQVALERAETAWLVRAVLDRLPGRYGQALHWKYLEEVPVAEIASRLDLSPKAAESLLTRAREAFRLGFAALTGGRSWSRHEG